MILIINITGFQASNLLARVQGKRPMKFIPHMMSSNSRTLINMLEERRREINKRYTVEDLYNPQTVAMLESLNETIDQHIENVTKGFVLIHRAITVLA